MQYFGFPVLGPCEKMGALSRGIGLMVFVSHSEASWTGWFLADVCQAADLRLVTLILVDVAVMTVNLRILLSHILQ